MDDRTLSSGAGRQCVELIAIHTDQPTQVIQRLDDLGGLLVDCRQLVAEAQQAQAADRHRLVLIILRWCRRLFVNTMLNPR